MSDRTVPFDESANCDGCGRKGAFDFMGDLYCQDCMNGGKSERKPINPLYRFLNRSSVDDLLAFIHSLHLQYSLVCNDKGGFRMEIRQEGMLQHAGSGGSAKTAIVGALASFLKVEDKDFHEYQRKGNGIAERGHGNSMWKP